jgi:hypothetical protein
MIKSGSTLQGKTRKSGAEFSKGKSFFSKNEKSARTRGAIQMLINDHQLQTGPMISGGLQKHRNPFVRPREHFVRTIQTKDDRPWPLFCCWAPRNIRRSSNPHADAIRRLNDAPPKLNGSITTATCGSISPPN